MKQFLLFLVYISMVLPLPAQEILKLTRDEAEALFLQNNLLLIAEKLNIESQQAEVIQARLWPNPEFSVSEVNLWRTSQVESSPPFFDDFGRDQQIAFEINQLIQTAGKRKKLIALEKVDVAISEQYFEDVLRGLKLELRSQINELQYVQQSAKLHEHLIENINVLIQAYQNQLNSGHLSKTEYIRLKAQKLEIERELLTLAWQSNEIQKELKLLLRTHPNVTLEITGNNHPFIFQNITLEQILEEAKESRPDYKMALLKEKYSHQLLDYEKAQRIPDLTFGVNYDRNGSTMLDFVGFGVTLDLPLFDRRKGNIQKAYLGIEQAKVLKQHTLLSIENEIFQSYQSLQQSIEFLEKIDADYEADLDDLLEKYTQNFASRNVSMLAYFDFINAYLSNKKILLEAQKDVRQKIEELNYSLGKDL